MPRGSFNFVSLNLKQTDRMLADNLLAGDWVPNLVFEFIVDLTTSTFTTIRSQATVTLHTSCVSLGVEVTTFLHIVLAHLCQLFQLPIFSNSWIL